MPVLHNRSTAEGLEPLLNHMEALKKDNRVPRPWTTTPVLFIPCETALDGTSIWSGIIVDRRHSTHGIRAQTPAVELKHCTPAYEQPRYGAHRANGWLLRYPLTP
jgi:hypothetical protein